MASTRSRSEVSIAKGKGFSELAVERGFCKPKHIVQAVQEQTKLKQEEGLERSLKQILLERGVLSPTQVEEIEAARRGAKLIAGFELLEQVGQGAMGTVFKARQIALDRVVALKVLSPNLAEDKLFKERFLREARFSAKLNHINVISGIDCGEANGYLYFAMDFVDGKTTGQMMKEKGRLSVEEAIKIVRQVCEALQYAQSFDLVHRDVKPDNVMVDREDTAKLCDLGLATLRRVDRSARWGDKEEEEDEDEGGATRAGRVVGTPFYISPEQAKGSEKADKRCDMYSLGATLYHYLTGRPPFEGRSRQVMKQHVKGEAPGVCELNKQVPVVLGQIVSKMMAKEPEDRYADPEALIADLDAAVEGRAVTAAEFKAKTSCAYPARGLRRPQMPRPKVATATKSVAMVRSKSKSRPKSVKKIVPVLKKKQDTTKRMEPATPSAPAPRVSRTVRRAPPRRSSDSTSAVIFLLLAVVAAAVIYNYMSNLPTPPPPPTKPYNEPRVEPLPPPPAKKKTKRTPVDRRKPIDKKAPDVDQKTKDALGRVVDLPPDPIPQKKIEPPPPKVDTAAQRAERQKARALFVTELTKRVAQTELAKAEAVLDELIARPEFSLLKDEAETERTYLQSALAYESVALNRLASGRRRKKIKLTESGRRKCQGRDEIALQSFKSDRGVQAKLGRVTITLQPMDLDAADVVKQAAGAGDPEGRVCYLVARGRIASARSRLPQLDGEMRKRFEEKLGMLAEYEKESEAAAAFELLKRMAADENWIALSTAVSTFEREHAGTAVARLNAAKINDWKSKAENIDVPDLTRQFSVKPERTPDGGYIFTWTSRQREQFEKDWEIDDPGKRRGFVVWKPQLNTVLALRGRSGDFWDGERRAEAVVVSPREQIKAPHYRLEVYYTLGNGCKGGFIAGVGVWDGGSRGVAFGPREGRGGRLSLTGCPPGMTENVEKKNLPSAILADRGQLAVEVRGNEYTFLSRRYEDESEEGWRKGASLKGATAAKVAIMPVTWAMGSIDFIIHKVRLVILPVK